MVPLGIAWNVMGQRRCLPKTPEEFDHDAAGYGSYLEGEAARPKWNCRAEDICCAVYVVNDTGTPEMLALSTRAEVSFKSGSLARHGFRAKSAAGGIMVEASVHLPQSLRCITRLSP